MKLALATAFLARGLPVTTSSSFPSSSSSHHALLMLPAAEDRRHLVDDRTGSRRGQQGPGGRGRGAFRPSGVDGRKVRSGLAAHVLRNLKELQDEVVVECDPTLAGTVGWGRGEKAGPGDSHEEDRRADALDVGVLGCGVGRYCAESSDSHLGGLCADVRSDIVSPDAPRHHDGEEAVTRFQREDQRRDLQDGTLIEELQFVCEYGSEVGTTCECDFADYTYFGNYTASVTCFSPPLCTTVRSLCGANSTTCYEYAYSIDVLGQGSYDTELCTSYSVPYNQTVCYSTSKRDYGTTMEECAIGFNGVQCDSCSPIPYVNTTGSDTTTYNFCYDFDCSNTDGGSTGNHCGSPVATIKAYSQTYGCVSCSLCDPEDSGNGAEVTLPDEIITLFGNNYTCQDVSDVALDISFSPEQCAYVSDLVYEPCGCAGAAATDPTASPPPTKAPLPCDPCPGGGGLLNPNSTFIIPLPDGVPGSDDLISCEEVATAKISADLCPAVQEAASGPCCTADGGDGPTEACNPCGEDREMTILDGMVSFPTLGLFECQDLLDLAEAGNLTEGLCLVARTFVETPCGCRATAPTVTPSESPAGSPSTAAAPEAGASSAAGQTMTRSWTFRLLACTGIALAAHALFVS